MAEATVKSDCQCVECSRCLSLLALALAAEEWHGGRISEEQLHDAVDAYQREWFERKAVTPCE